MDINTTNKYEAYNKVIINKREWPDKAITKAPLWCSVDLRDGNQALIKPMSIISKLKYFDMLIKIGFKEIEVGFPSASKIEYDFCRHIIDNQLIPSDVRIQVLVQSREHLIAETLKAVAGSINPVIHLYNPTSEQQRRIVFNKSKSEIIEIALQGVCWIKQYSEQESTPVTLEYSPESFSATEPDFALEICNEVIKEWNPSKENKMIINLPSTVEMSTANVFADRIEWMHKNIIRRDSIILSIHTHNDRGCAVASAELAIMAGAERVEGTLFGNGERTGNADIVTLALNLYTQGIYPQLDFSNLPEIAKKVTEFNDIPIHPRHPYSGDLVFTAFSGSHQDAIKKGFLYAQKNKSNIWDIPYLPMDPEDIGRSYEGIIRINSQSGKGGIAYILQQEKGYTLPQAMTIEMAKIVQNIADTTGLEIDSQQLVNIFEKKYIYTDNFIKFINLKVLTKEGHCVSSILEVQINGINEILKGTGIGPIDACLEAINKSPKLNTINIIDYSEHALQTGSEAQAIAYTRIASNNKQAFGAGIDTDITIAAVKSIISAINRLPVDL